MNDKPTVVGIGTSAGGLAALKTLFIDIPADSGLAWVVVVHLSPDHDSHLAELLQRHAKLPVRQVTESTPIEVDRVYLIPPNANLEAIDTHLRLSKLEDQRRARAPVDHFFRTLARTHDGHAVGIVLSGTGSDGALGVKAIKEKGGLTIAQNPRDAEYDGMPRSAIATGMIDLVLPLDEIAGAVLRYSRTEPRVRVAEGARQTAESQRFLRRIFAQIGTLTGRDFTGYKQSTILRRISRRMQIHQLEEVEDYLERLNRDPEEVRTLSDDLLITVTRFFRDRQVHEQLEKQVIPQVFASKKAGDDLRCWSVGCATGEEAYSLAILLLEEAARHDNPPQIQVFASDLHVRSLERAREGFYLGDIEADVSAERLRRFFTRENGGYRVRKEVREIVIFAPHNLLADPPFSRLDLISCRNLLIYLHPDTQLKVAELFHYALRPDGWLVVGTSETIGRSGLFTSEGKKLCLYRRRAVPIPEPRLPVFPLVHRQLAEHRLTHEPSVERASFGDLHSRMVERLAPPSLLVGPDDQVVHISEHAGRYLVHPGGEPTASVFKLIREELRGVLRAALAEARSGGHPLRTQPVEVRFNGETSRVALDVRASRLEHGKDFVLMIFDEHPREGEDSEDAEDAPRTLEKRDEGQVHELKIEIDLLRQRLQTVIDEYENSREEMKAANEELQSVNEELRSTMEELETSKEELQSMNEELQTVNQENRHRVEELAQLSDDLRNFLGATEIATLFLDRDLRILRFTPRVEELFNIRITDCGRPISDLTHRLGYDELRDDAHEVLARLIPVEREVRHEEGPWFLTRVLPYRSSQDKIEGVVITFVDITDRKRAEEALRDKTRKLEAEDERRQLFLAILGHELRNPLAALDSAMQGIEEGGYDTARLHSIMGRQIDQLKMLVTDLLEMSRFTHGRISLRQTRTDLATVIRDVAESVASSVESKNQELVLQLDESVPVDGDPTRLAQVVGNLLSNASKFTPAEKRIEVVLEREGDEARIEVRDEGQGISRHELTEIFEPFVQREPGHGGLGIGLALVKRLVELHGGTVTAASAGDGLGSVFTVRLPVSKVEERNSTPEPRRERSREAFEGTRVLIVEDTRDAADTLALLLERRGATTECAYTGAEGLENVKAWKPNVVLIDIGLPDLSGYEVARRIRAQDGGGDVLLLAVTGFSDSETENDALDAGFDERIVKPIELDHLNDLITRHLEGMTTGSSNSPNE